LGITDVVKNRNFVYTLGHLINPRKEGAFFMSFSTRSLSAQSSGIALQIFEEWEHAVQQNAMVAEKVLTEMETWLASPTAAASSGGRMYSQITEQGRMSSGHPASFATALAGASRNLLTTASDVVDAAKDLKRASDPSQGVSSDTEGSHLGGGIGRRSRVHLSSVGAKIGEQPLEVVNKDGWLDDVHMHDTTVSAAPPSGGAPRAAPVRRLLYANPMVGRAIILFSGMVVSEYQLLNQMLIKQLRRMDTWRHVQGLLTTEKAHDRLQRLDVYSLVVRSRAKEGLSAFERYVAEIGSIVLQLSGIRDELEGISLRTCGAHQVERVTQRPFDDDRMRDEATMTGPSPLMPDADSMDGEAATAVADRDPLRRSVAQDQVPADSLGGEAARVAADPGLLQKLYDQFQEFHDKFQELHDQVRRVHDQVQGLHDRLQGPVAQDQGSADLGDDEAVSSGRRAGSPSAPLSDYDPMLGRAVAAAAAGSDQIQGLHDQIQGLRDQIQQLVDQAPIPADPMLGRAVAAAAGSDQIQGLHDQIQGLRDQIQQLVAQAPIPADPMLGRAVAAAAGSDQIQGLYDQIQGLRDQVQQLVVQAPIPAGPMRDKVQLRKRASVACCYCSFAAVVAATTVVVLAILGQSLSDP
jgi:hypothetical protein